MIVGNFTEGVELIKIHAHKPIKKGEFIFFILLLQYLVSYWLGVKAH